MRTPDLIMIKSNTYVIIGMLCDNVINFVCNITMTYVNKLCNIGFINVSYSKPLQLSVG